MTDAERWRQIAETKAWDSAGLCWALRCYGESSTDDPQTLRMWNALQMFRPSVPSGYWWPIYGQGDTERTYACLLLAAMAEADGGNHKETTR